MVKASSHLVSSRSGSGTCQSNLQGTVCSGCDGLGATILILSRLFSLLSRMAFETWWIVSGKPTLFVGERTYSGFHPVLEAILAVCSLFHLPFEPTLSTYRTVSALDPGLSFVNRGLIVGTWTILEL